MMSEIISKQLRICQLVLKWTILAHWLYLLKDVIAHMETMPGIQGARLLKNRVTKKSGFESSESSPVFGSDLSILSNIHTTTIHISHLSIHLAALAVHIEAFEYEFEFSSHSIFFLLANYQFFSFFLYKQCKILWMTIFILFFHSLLWQ